MPPRVRLRSTTTVPMESNKLPSQKTNSVRVKSGHRSPSKVSPAKKIKLEPSLSPEKLPAKRSKTLVKQALIEPQPAPPRWKETYELIKEQRKTFVAPVDTMGCERPGDVEIDYEPGIHDPSTQDRLRNPSERDRRFFCLVSLMLSSQTKDEVTSQAVTNLRSQLKDSLSVDSLRNASVEEIGKCINKVGFWRKKAVFIKEMAQELFLKHNSDVPKTLEELVALKGVGPKMAFLALSCAWSINLGIGVDTHVHRITNRMGWLNTSTPEATRVHLESWLPKDLFQDINFMLVGFGQVICLPVGPKCGQCYVGKVKGLCPSSQAESNKAKSKKKMQIPSRTKVDKSMRPEDSKENVTKIKSEEDSRPVQEVQQQLRASRYFNRRSKIKLETDDGRGSLDQAPSPIKIAVEKVRVELEDETEVIQPEPDSWASSPLSEVDAEFGDAPYCSHPSLSW